MRLFVAADVPDDVRGELYRRGEALAAAGGWRPVREDGLHLTLAFLGERPDEEAASLPAVLSPLARALAPVSLAHEILLPRGAPRVAAIELDDPAGRLRRLQADVTAALEGAGAYRPEKRPWLPHVTVARRTRGAPASLEPPEWRAGAFHVPSMTLYRSRLHPSGARYEPLARIELGAD